MKTSNLLRCEVIVCHTALSTGLIRLGPPDAGKLEQLGRIHRPSAVDICMKDGTVFTGCEPHVKGHPQNPMTFDEVAEKFNLCASFSAKPLSRDGLDRFIGKVACLDRDDDVRDLVADLA